MATIGSLAISLVARTSEFSAGMSRASKKIDEFKMKAAAAKTGGFFSGGFDLAKFEKFETKSAAGVKAARAFQLAMGGGMAGAVVMVSRKLEEFGNAASDAAGKLIRGEQSIGDFAAQALRAVPVLGDMVQTFDSLGAAAWDSAAAIADWAGASSKTVNWLTSDRTKIAEAAEMVAQREKQQQAALEASNKVLEESKRIAEEKKRVDDRRLDAIADIVSAATQEAQALGRTNAELAQARLVTLGATQADIEALSAANNLVEAYNVQQEKLTAATEAAQAASAAMRESLVADANSLVAETRTPFERYAAEVDKIQALVIAGAIDDDTANRASNAAIKQLAEARKKMRAEMDAAAGGIAEQVHLSRTFVPGLQKKQEQKDPQLVVTNNLLKRIAVNTAKATAAVAA